MILRKTLANAIRVLSIDAIQHANSGHPGMPMGMADIAEVLWRDYMNHNPQNPTWINRDRFILSNGHGAMLLYSLLHLTGYNLTIEDLKHFRQLNSKTPGHPECGETEGIEITTGPLGQGIANAVGMAIAEKTLAAQFNKTPFNIIDHYTYVFLGDGCIMEGISHEACSLAGKLKLNKLIAFYDDNNISIDGNVEDCCSDDTAARFESYGWNVIRNIDGHNSNKIKQAIENARSILNKPSLIICKTIIGYGSPNKSGKNTAHGAPLGEHETLITKNTLNWKEEPFIIPEHIYEHWNAKIAGQNKENTWNKKFSEYSIMYPTLAIELKRRINKQLPKIWNTHIQTHIASLLNHSQTIISTRQISQNILEILGPILPEFLGGSADLTSSNLTSWSHSTPITKKISGNYIHYGVREFGMTAIANGISHYGGFLPYTATFLTFTGYAQNAIRMAALMKTKHIMIYTHDSIGLGEDGPTHQPIEQLSSLRMIPNLNIWRPCDQIETIIAWKSAIENYNKPTALILSRQNLPQQQHTSNQIENIAKGGYILKDCKNLPTLIIISTGSEIQLAIDAYYILTKKGFDIRVVSLPSTNTFDCQNKEYKELVLPKKITKRLAIEASSSDYWYKYVGLNGAIIGMNTFGKSAPSKDLFEFFGFTTHTIIQKAYDLLNQ
ncbi:transketolase [Blochmannia endosymbiont of Polyrhachis (Hedomyrma) turneri]|uniref:transketolase n=1 Tax=Blochmannia endosymbiont of Polyrhachis (Hedomyrma) turneri TaxID=1505596 RepID=UPI00061A7226|nr:transketolase [Blochmannia endosymbiont of Polyrhachis (Hedomyrma) turneri]AKC60076.1 transketolase 1 [Blochmannia endosymbiont of Polyrhachis (Hedomyrma) turneri]